MTGAGQATPPDCAETNAAEAVDALVVGAGPAGLAAAEMLAAAGRRVVVTDAMPSPARKLLMAGKSGLNLTRDEDPDQFAGHVASGTRPEPRASAEGQLTLEQLRAIVAGFGPAEVTEWAEALGITLFAGSTGRVFPVGMKASPLLRAWLARLARNFVVLRTRWRWTGFSGPDSLFDTPTGPHRLRAAVTVLALGGASWPRLGSDAAWVPALADAGVKIFPFRPANMGFRVLWSPHMAPFFGHAVKGVALSAGPAVSRGEFVITPSGIEGGGVYEIAAALRDGAAGFIDLSPSRDHDALTGRLGAAGRASIGNRLRRALGDPARVALALEWGRPLPTDPAALAQRLKALPIRHDGAFGLARAISSAGGISLDALTPALELRARPGCFVAGEMIDWEAPTGGYLLTTCLATGRAAGRAAAAHHSVDAGSPPPHADSVIT